MPPAATGRAHRGGRWRENSELKAIRRILTGRTLIFVGATFLLAGCGYRTERPFRTDVKSVAVDIFDTKEFRRNLELQLAEALTKRLEAETPYKLMKKDVADTVLSGEIIEVRQSTIGRDFRNNLPRETSATMVVAFRWKDLRTGQTLIDRPRFVQTVDYVRPLNEDFYHASQRICDRMAERIVEQMMSEW